MPHGRQWAEMHAISQPSIYDGVNALLPSLMGMNRRTPRVPHSVVQISMVYKLLWQNDGKCLASSLALPVAELYIENCDSREMTTNSMLTRKSVDGGGPVM